MAEPKQQEEPSKPLKYQTWILKVSIHCEGCKKKVKKVLLNIDGVYEVDIDSRKNKVTVTGNVDSETLIKKLLKHGKLAEPWPVKEEKGKKEKSGKTQEPAEEEEKVVTEKTNENGGKGSPGKSRENNGDGSKKTTEKTDPALKSNGEAKPSSSESKKSANQENQATNSDGNSKKTAVSSNGEAETVGGNKTSGGGGGGGGGGKKKGKNKKKHGGNTNSGATNGVGKVTFVGASPSPVQPSIPAVAPVAVHSFIPAHVPPLVPPVSGGFSGGNQWSYAVNYNNSYPSYDTYTLPEMPTHTYDGPTYDEEYFLPESYTLPPEKYHIFSDENANACSVM